MSLKPNIEKLNEILQNQFKNNKAEFARALCIDRGQLSKILKDGTFTGTVFWSGLLKFCKNNDLRFEDYIFFDEDVNKYHTSKDADTDECKVNSHAS